MPLALRTLVLAATLAAAADADAQAGRSGALAPVARTCAGDTVTAIDIQVQPATSFGALERVSPSASQAVRSRFATTSPAVVRAYLRVEVGHLCTEIHRSESERLLRAQPFVASAVVRAVPDGPGRVRIEVDVVDELPMVVDGSLRRGNLESVRLGTLSLRGTALALSAGITRGFAYRYGFGVRAEQYGLFGRPFYVAASAERRPVGEAMSFEFAEPFLTQLQRQAFRVGVRESSDYLGVVPPTGPDVALKTRRVSYDVGWVTRVGQLDRHHVAGFLGVALLGEQIRLGDTATIVSDSGLVLAPSVAFRAVYPDFAVVRMVAIVGVRSIHFLTVRGFDALTAQQDVGVGIQVHVLGGPSVWSARSLGESFIAGDLYAGLGDEESFTSVHVVSEERRDYYTPSWHGMVTSARLSWYARPSTRWTRVVSFTAAAMGRLDFPAQLTFRDAEGGVAGFAGARAAGGSRAVLRVEQRRLIGLLHSRADVAVAAFADAGKLWEGDVPYGQTSPVRASLGLSLLAAYPSGGKRTYRIDLAMPLNPEPGGSRLEVRLSALDRTRLLWVEPCDVSRVRTGAVPATLTRW